MREGTGQALLRSTVIASSCVCPVMGAPGLSPSPRLQSSPFLLSSASVSPSSSSLPSHLCRQGVCGFRCTRDPGEPSGLGRGFGLDLTWGSCPCGFQKVSGWKGLLSYMYTSSPGALPMPQDLQVSQWLPGDLVTLPQYVCCHAQWGM
jgi:hypothetical protein